MAWSLTRGQTVGVPLLAGALVVSDTNEVIGHLERVLSTLKDAETGQRG